MRTVALSNCAYRNLKDNKFKKLHLSQTLAKKLQHNLLTQDYMDVISDIAPLLYALRILGLAPYKVASPRRLKRFVKTRSALLHAILMFITIEIFQIAMTWAVVLKFNLQGFLKVVSIISMGLVFAPTVLYVYNLINYRAFSDLVHGFRTFDLMNTSQVTIVSIRTSIILQLTSIFLFTGLINGLYIKYSQIDNKLKYLMVSWSFLYTVIFSVIDVLICSLFRLLKNRFQGINLHLDAVINNLYLPEELLPSFLQPFTNSLLPQLAKVTVTSNEVGSISGCHDFLCDLSEKLNRYFSVHAVLTVMIKFFTIVFGIFFLAVCLLRHDVGEFYSAFEVISTIIYMCLNALILVVVLWNSDSTSSEANRTAVLVHKLLNKTQDQELKEELQRFSLQLLHRKVQFTACGFFPLDFTLLYSIVGAVTTYLVILIQFQLAFNTPNSAQNSTSCPTLTTVTINDSALLGTTPGLDNV